VQDCRAVAILGPGGETHPEKSFAVPTKSSHLAFKIVITKAKILKIKPQTAINRHHAYVAVCFKILK